MHGCATAGLLLTTMGVIADRVPKAQRARWIGTVMGCYTIGFSFGPMLGGLLFDARGFAAPLLVSAGLGLIALVFALARLPETRGQYLRTAAGDRSPKRRLRAIRRRPGRLLTLLAIDFFAIFAFAFAETQLVFYAYESLGLSATRFGLVVGTYSLAMAIGQLVFGRLSEWSAAVWRHRRCLPPALWRSCAPPCWRCVRMSGARTWHLEEPVCQLPRANGSPSGHPACPWRYQPESWHPRRLAD